MDWIFNGFLSWAANILASVLDAITALFTSALSCDLTTFNNVFKFAQTAESVILGLGLSFLFMILIFQLFRTLWGPLADQSVEHPVGLLLRAGVFFPITYFSKSIVDYVLYLANKPYGIISGMSTDSGSGWASTLADNMKTWGGAVVSNLADPVGALLTIIILTLIGWNYLKLLLEVCERYVVLGVIAYTAPLAAATGGSKSTNQIFKGWCRLVGSQTFLMIFNVWFLALISSGLHNAGDYFKNDNGNLLIWALLMVAMEKAAQRMDSYMKSIVGNVAITGGGILDDLVATAGAVKGATKAVFGGGKGGALTGGLAAAAGGATAGTIGGFASAVGRKFSPSSFAADAAGSGGVRQSAGGMALGFAPAIARGVAGAAFKASLEKGGDFATSVVGRIAHGNGNKDYGHLNNTPAASKSFAHFFGSSGYPAPDMHSTTIGNGEATTRVGTDTTLRYFDADKFRAPDAGTYTRAQAADGSTWYKQEFKDTDASKPKAPERL